MTNTMAEFMLRLEKILTLQLTLFLIINKKLTINMNWKYNRQGVCLYYSLFIILIFSCISIQTVVHIYWYFSIVSDHTSPLLLSLLTYLLTAAEHVCAACDCDPIGSEHGGECESRTDVLLDLVAGRCICKRLVMGRRCDTCMDGYWNMKADNPDGCEGR